MPAKREQNAVGPLLLNNALYKLRRHGLEINRVGHVFGGLHRSNIGVDEHRMDALFLQRLQGLRSAIVEFAGLTYFQGARAKDHNLLISRPKPLPRRGCLITNISSNISGNMFFNIPPFGRAWVGFQQFYEFIEHPFRISRS